LRPPDRARGRVGPAEPEIDAALAHYRQAVLHMDLDEVVATFDDDALIAHEELAPVVGRQNIRRFFASFADYHLLSYEIAARATSLRGTIATQRGSYRQRVVTPDGLTVDIEGSFRAEWQRQADGRWLLHSMRTAPT
jgi:uncharacterized protein (TIGR02246 family)